MAYYNQDNENKITNVSLDYLDPNDTETQIKALSDKVGQFGNLLSKGQIDGRNIKLGSITTSEISFTPTDSDNIIGTINASSEGITIDADNIEISGSTTFTSGYDPSDTKAVIRQDSEPSNRDSGDPLQVGDTWIDTNDGDKPYTYNGTNFIQAYTIIDGGNITTGTITASEIAGDTITASQIAANTITASEISSSTITTSELNFSPYVVGTNTLDDIADGSSYERIASSAVSSGLPLLSEASGDLDDIGNGTDYGKVKNTQISAGEIILSAVSGDLDDISDGTNYGKVDITDISSGHIVLSTCTGDLDDIADGTSYGKVKKTQISAGEIILSAVSGDTSDITEATDYNFVTDNEKTGAGRGYSAINSSNRYQQWLQASELTSGSNPSTGLIIDSGGIRGYSSGTNTFDIDASTGNAYFKGELAATSGFIGGTSSGWDIDSGYLKSTSGDIELKGTSTSHIKAISGVDSTDYIQITAASNAPRVDLYKNGTLRTRLVDSGLSFYNSSGTLVGTLDGSKDDGPHFDNDIVLNRGEGLMCEYTSGNYFRVFMDSASDNAIIDLPATDELKIQQNDGFAIMRLYGDTAGWGDQFIDLFGYMRLYEHYGTPAISPYEGMIYFDTDSKNFRGYNGTDWVTLG